MKRKADVWFYDTSRATILKPLGVRIEEELWDESFGQVVHDHEQRSLHGLEDDVRPGRRHGSRLIVIVGTLEELREYWPILKAKNKKVAVLLIDVSPFEAEETNGFLKEVGRLPACEYLWRGNEAEIPPDFSTSLKKQRMKLIVGL